MRATQVGGGGAVATTTSSYPTRASYCSSRGAQRRRRRPGSSAQRGCRGRACEPARGRRRRRRVLSLVGEGVGGGLSGELVGASGELMIWGGRATRRVRRVRRRGRPRRRDGLAGALPRVRRERAARRDGLGRLRLRLRRVVGLVCHRMYHRPRLCCCCAQLHSSSTVLSPSAAVCDSRLLRGQRLRWQRQWRGVDMQAAVLWADGRRWVRVSRASSGGLRRWRRRLRSGHREPWLRRRGCRLRRRGRRRRMMLYRLRWPAAVCGSLG